MSMCVCETVEVTRQLGKFPSGRATYQILFENGSTCRSELIHFFWLKYVYY